MDAIRFDAWTRRRLGLTAGGALAALLGGTLAPVLGPPDAAAKKGKKKGKKKKKKGKGQCTAMAKPCEGSGECCGALICGGPDDTCCAPITGACSGHEQCCVGACATDGEGVPRCCLPDGFPCTLVRECCSGLCQGNVCATPNPGPICLDNGEICQGSDECCGSSICSGSDHECCTPLAAECSGNQDCCLGVCRTDDEGVPRCCSQEGAFCNLGRECCSGVCQPNHMCAPTGPTCLGNGTACDDSGACCSGYCDEGGEDRCCVPMDGVCTDAGDCCEHPFASSEACEFSNGANRCCGMVNSACGPTDGPSVTCCPGLDCECIGFACLCV
jgi:hypothetical protein